MKPTTLLKLLSFVIPAPSLAFIGYGIEMYKPFCAFSCRAAIASAPLSCSEHDPGQGGHMGHGGGLSTPECRAGDTSFLTTLAWCINSTCADSDIDTWKLEKYWRDQTTGDVQVLPKWTYGEALAEVTKTPNRELAEEDMLDFTAVVPHESWMSQKMTMMYFEEQETLHSRYGIVLLVVGFATPILFTLLGCLPYMTSLFERIKPYVVYPSIIGTYQVRPLPYRLGNAPTIGHSLYIAMFFILNLVLASVNYRATQPNTFFASTYQEIMGYISCRTGVLAFALAPLLILFSGRNNVLLWLTNWSHSTYMLLHRWVARIFAVQVIVHSVVELVLYINMGELKAETKQPYWIWGIVATLATCIMLIASLLFVRRWSYEVFLITHIVLAVFVLVGSWYHVEFRFTRKWGYELWLYAACAVWFFDRLLRVFRIAKNGIRHATVTEIGQDMVRVDVNGVRWAAEPGMHTYVFFPSLNPLKPWENHPFSVIPTPLLKWNNDNGLGLKGDATTSSSENHDIEKSAIVPTNIVPLTRGATSAGVSLYIRKSAGSTKFLKSHDELVTFLDGPYFNHPTKAVRKCDRLVLIGGGIGITGLLPFIAGHTNVKLYWSVRDTSQAIVRDLELALRGAVQKEIKVGRRLDVEALMADEEAGGWAKIGVVVCGPGGLCDDVRAVVARKGREGKLVWELEVDAFSW